ncbi:Elf1-domain-containing protein [Tilletiaria anomala UBC 951]|uniref:Transcription elongation factor 1 homolog n=1 Tax=Tilletiaria anomala (strain ATCC 24038 / CBS 436.72 / UBC 951) TaxID=1037660 RepID=A0A066VYQ8_TILAU|nr:Elf1-domain-containing protein [Tilletiaria anomala UBC 951]KDN43944.1 Elf1-domain-containing protein [Tilletiaria anomala UBC 951]
MGKRKSSRKPQGSKKREPLETQFTCLFCNHPKAVTCKIDTTARIGYLKCKVCGQEWSHDTDALSEPIDVYSLWIDACEEVNKEN